MYDLQTKSLHTVPQYKEGLCKYHKTFKNHYQLELEGNNNETLKHYGQWHGKFPVSNKQN